MAQNQDGHKERLTARISTEGMSRLDDMALERRLSKQDVLEMAIHEMFVKAQGSGPRIGNYRLTSSFNGNFVRWPVAHDPDRVTSRRSTDDPSENSNSAQLDIEKLRPGYYCFLLGSRLITCHISYTDVYTNRSVSDRTTHDQAGEGTCVLFENAHLRVLFDNRFSDFSSVEIQVKADEEGVFSNNPPLKSTDIMLDILWQVDGSQVEYRLRPHDLKRHMLSHFDENGPYSELMIDILEERGEIENENYIGHPLLLWPESSRLPRFMQLDSYSVQNCKILQLGDGSRWRDQSDRPRLERTTDSDESRLEMQEPWLLPYVFHNYNSRLRIEGQGIRPVDALFSVETYSAGIDNLVLCRALWEQGFLEKSHIDSVLSASLSGLEGLLLHVNNENSSLLSILDITGGYRTYVAKLNAAWNNIRSEEFRIVPNGEDALRLGNGDPYSIFVGVPPYLPKPEDEELAQSPILGNEFLKDTLLANFHSICDEAVIGISSVIDNDFDQWCKSHELKQDLLLEQRVPLSIETLMPRHPDLEVGARQGSHEWSRAEARYRKLRRYWEDVLLAKEPYNLDPPEQGDTQYRFWHTIKIFHVRPK